MSRAFTRAAGCATCAAAAPALPFTLRSTEAATDAAMDRFAAGDLAAFSEVYSAALPRVSRTLGRLTRQREAAEDLAQETMLRIYSSRSRWRQGSRVLPWAHAIARRLFIDRVRRRRREQRAYDALAHGEAQGRPDLRPDTRLAVRRKAAALAATLERLPPTQRDALRMVCIEGKSLADVSTQLGETNVAVRVRVHRARGTLAAALSEH